MIYHNKYYTNIKIILVYPNIIFQVPMVCSFVLWKKSSRSGQTVTKHKIGCN
jgi:hypothetical protein